MLNKEVFLITGGTGYLGTAVMRRFLDSALRENRIVSAMEKQDNMRKPYKNANLKF